MTGHSIHLIVVINFLQGILGFPLGRKWLYFFVRPLTLMKSQNEEWILKIAHKYSKFQFLSPTSALNRRIMATLIDSDCIAHQSLNGRFILKKITLLLLKFISLHCQSGTQ